MAAHLTPEQHEEAIKLQRQGRTCEQIASSIGVHRNTVGRALNRHNRRMFARIEKRAAAYKAKQIAQLEHLFADAVNEWHRSKLDVETVETTDPGGDETPRTKTVVKGQTGNPAILSQARGALSDIREILGLDAPKAADITSNGKEIGRGPAAWSNLSTDELLALRSLLARAASPRPDGGDPAD